MSKMRLNFKREMFVMMSKASLAVLAVTALFLLIGRPTLGEAVIALLYVVPVGWATSRWGPWPGIAAAVVAALCFDFFFIPPFLTFSVGSLEGWLVLAIFLAVALVVVGRVQAGLSRAQASEREAVMMYELGAALAGPRTQAAVAQSLAQQLQQMFQAANVKVIIQPDAQAPGLEAAAPQTAMLSGRPDLILPILNAWGLAGEIQFWQGSVPLPAQDGRLFRNFTSQAAQALERTKLAETDPVFSGLASKVRAN